MTIDNSVWKKMEANDKGLRFGELLTFCSSSNAGKSTFWEKVAQMPEVQEIARKTVAMSQDNAETPKERARRMGVPYVKPHPILPIVNGNPVVAVCGGCGRDVHYMESYSCPNVECPIQRRVSF